MILVLAIAGLVLLVALVWLFWPGEAADWENW
jgi:hypothetical protein